MGDQKNSIPWKLVVAGSVVSFLALVFFVYIPDRNLKVQEVNLNEMNSIIKLIQEPDDYLRHQNIQLLKAYMPDDKYSLVEDIERELNRGKKNKAYVISKEIESILSYKALLIQSDIKNEEERLKFYRENNVSNGTRNKLLELNEQAVEIRINQLYNSLNELNQLMDK